MRNQTEKEREENQTGRYEERKPNEREKNSKVI